MCMICDKTRHAATTVHETYSDEKFRNYNSTALKLSLPIGIHYSKNLVQSGYFLKKAV